MALRLALTCAWVQGQMGGFGGYNGFNQPFYPGFNCFNNSNQQGYGSSNIMGQGTFASLKLCNTQQPVWQPAQSL